MKFSAMFVLLTAMLVAVCAQPFNVSPSLPKSNPHGARFPNFQGFGPFYPRSRHSRSPGGSVIVDQPINGPASVSADMNHRVFENQYGHISVYGGGKMQNGGQPEGSAGIRGEFHWGAGAGGGMNDAARMAEIDRIRKEMKID